MRRGEVLGLRWRDIDLDAGRLSVSQTVVAPEGKVQFSSPKTEKGRRSVALDTGTVEEIRAHRRRQLQERLAFGAGYSDLDLVFCEADGEALSPNAFSQAFDRRVNSSGLPRIRLHDLRHTHATLGLSAGVHAKVMSERLGHSTVSITLDIYSHAVPGLQEDAAERLGALVLGSTRPPAGSS
jgi:integrase